MKTEISFRIEVTLSKILAFIVVGLGAAYVFATKDPEVWVLASSWAAASALVLNKQYQDRYKEVAKLEYENGNGRIESEVTHDIVVEEKP